MVWNTIFHGVIDDSFATFVRKITENRIERRCSTDFIVMLYYTDARTDLHFTKPAMRPYS